MNKLRLSLCLSTASGAPTGSVCPICAIFHPAWNDVSKNAHTAQGEEKACEKRDIVYKVIKQKKAFVGSKCLLVCYFSVVWVSLYFLLASVISGTAQDWFKLVKPKSCGVL